MIGSYYTNSFSMLYITLHYKCKIHVLYQIIQYCLILKKNVVYDAPKHLKMSSIAPIPPPQLCLSELKLDHQLLLEKFT